MNKRSVKATVENEKGTRVELVINLVKASDGPGGSAEIEYKAMDASGTPVDTIDTDEDTFGFFTLVNDRVGSLSAIFDSTSGGVN